MGRMLKQFEEARREATELHAGIMSRIKIANEIARKVREFLPEGWTFCFVLGWDGLLFSKSDSADVFEFRNVCNLVEKIIGGKMERYPWMMEDSKNKEYVFCFYGKVILPEIRVEVRMFLPYDQRDECVIEYEDKIVKVAKIDPGCLGNHDKNNLSKEA